MSFLLPELPDYDALLYEALHESMDHLIDLGARCNAHADVLEADDDDSSDDSDGPHPVKVLKAQLNLDGAEDEVQEVQRLIQVLSQILITRHTRRVVHYGSPIPADSERSVVRSFPDTAELPSLDGPDLGAEDSSSVSDSAGE